MTDLLDCGYLAYHDRGRIDSASSIAVEWPAPMTSRHTSKRRSWVAPVAARLMDLSRLPPGWDGSDARPVRWPIIELAARVLAAIAPDGAPPPHILPRWDGGLHLEWHEGSLDLELALHPGGFVEVSADDDVTGDEVDGALGEVEEQVKQLVRRMMERQDLIRR